MNLVEPWSCFCPAGGKPGTELLAGESIESFSTKRLRGCPKIHPDADVAVDEINRKPDGTIERHRHEN